MVVLHFHLASPLYAFCIEFRSGLNLLIKCFSFSFLAIILSEFILKLKKGNIKYLGSLSEQVAICPLTGIIWRFSCLMCWLCSVVRFLKLFVSPIEGSFWSVLFLLAKGSADSLLVEASSWLCVDDATSCGWFLAQLWLGESAGTSLTR